MDGRPDDPPSPVIDLGCLEALRELGGEDDPGLVAELVEVFLVDAPERIQEMHRALTSGDMTLLERAAHTLKSSAANLGACVLSAEARELEVAVRSGSGSNLALLANRCETALEAARAELQRLVG